MTDQIPAGEPPLGSLACPEPEDRPDLWPTTARRTDDGELVLGGLTVSEILAEAPSPVFVLDEADLRGRAASWAAAMHEEFWPSYGMAGGEAFYAGKAFLTTKVAQWVLEEGMGIDTASRGELAVSLAALQEVDGEKTTTDATRLGLHGNGKTQAEIAVALTHHVGHLVLDSLEEVELAVRAVRELRASGVYGPEETGKVMVRLTTGVHAGGQAHHDLASLLGPVDATGAQLAHGADGELNLLERVEDEVTHVVGEGDGDLGLCLAVTVQAQTGGVRGGLLPVHLLQGGQGYGELAAAGGVDAHALLEDPLGDLGGQEGLPGVEGLSPSHAVAGPELLMHGGGPGGGATAQVRLIQDEDGARGLGEDLGDGQPTQDELAVVRAPCRGGPQVGTVLGLGAGQ